MKFNKLASFMHGMGNIYNLLPPPVEDPFQGKTDLQRLQKDWENIGNDMRKSLAREIEVYEYRSSTRYNKV
ncbi:MAG TPA: hypothetical protein VHE99_00890 [Gammaproteobacteria bacterium]|nr:hypothetical protein [Gammaproteobacteria bacterium]